MKVVNQHIHGQLLDDNGRFALLLTDPKPQSESAASLFLTYAFVTMGTEALIFPTFILDDWGAEIRGLKLYRWFRTYAEQFPRAEIFGFTQDGAEVQCFVRELEIYAKWPCFALAKKGLSLTTGKLVEAVLLPQPNQTQPESVRKPPAARVKRPLRQAKLSWWLVPDNMQQFRFAKPPKGIDN